MKKHLYEIKKLKIPAYLKWWFIKKKFAGTLSEILENLTSPITLTNSLKRKFKIFEIGGNSVQDGDPSPETQVPIQNVTGNVEVKVENKNLAVLNVGTYGNYRLINPIEVKENDIITIITSYTSANQQAFLRPTLYNNKEMMSGSGIIKEYLGIEKGNDTLTLITIEQDGYFGISCGYGISSVTISKLFVGKGTYTLNDYVAHEEQTAIFPLEEGQVLHEGDKIEDKIIQNRITVVFDGTEDWQITEIKTNTALHWLQLSGAVKSNLLLCTVVPYNTSIYNADILGGYIATSNNRIFIRETHLDNASWKAYLAQQYANGTPVTVEYELTEPIEIPFTEAQRTAKAQIDSLYSYKGTTYISSANNPSPLFTIQYVKEET